MGVEENRFRDRNIHIMVTDYEYKLIKQRQEESGCRSLREYIMKAATEGYLIKVDYSDIKDLTYEINKIGTNINQIAHRVNSEQAVYKPQMDEIQEEVSMIWKILRAKFYQIP